MVHQIELSRDLKHVRFTMLAWGLYGNLYTIFARKEYKRTVVHPMSEVSFSAEDDPK